MKRYMGTARICLLCDGTGVQEDEDGEWAYRCHECHGTGIRWGLSDPWEWSALGYPLGLPVRLIREVYLPHRTNRTEILRALQELGCLLGNATQGTRPDAQSCLDVEDAKDHKDAMLWTEFDFPFLAVHEYLGPTGGRVVTGAVVASYEAIGQQSA